MNRGRELAHIDNALEAARHGESRTLALHGLSGVGKTALVQAAIGRATDFGLMQLRGTDQPQPSEWPQPLAELLVRHEECGQPASLDDAVDASVRALRRIANFTRPPLLVVVDDCQLLPAWLPTALARAVGSDHLDLAVVLLLAWRDTPHTEPVVLDAPGVPEYELTTLDVDDAEVLLRRLDMAIPSRPVLRQLVRATGGVPFALLSTQQQLSPRQLDGSLPLPVPIPLSPSVVTAFEAPVRALPEPAQRAAAVVALGTPKAVAEGALERLGDGSADLRVLDATDIVNIRSHRIDFVHPLVRAAAFRRLPEDQQDQVQLAVADAYAALGMVEESALHRGQAARGPRNDVADLYARAARRGAQRGAFEQSATYAELAAQFTESDELAAVHRTEAAARWIASGNARRARQVLEPAARLSLSDHVRAEVLYHEARVRFALATDAEGPTLPASPSNTMVRAAELCETVTPHRAVLMLVDAAALQLFRAPGANVVDIADRACRLADGVSTHLTVLATMTAAIARRAAGAPGAAIGDEQDINRLVAVCMGQTQAFPASPYLAQLIGEELMMRNDWDGAHRWAQWIAGCAESSGDRPLQDVASALTALLALNGGRLEDAVAYGQAAIEGTDDQLVARALGILAYVYSGTGDYQRTFETATRLFSMPGHFGCSAMVAAHLALASLELQRGHESAAAAWLETAMQEVVRDPAVPWTGGPVGPTAALGLVRMTMTGDGNDETLRLTRAIAPALPAGPLRTLWNEWLQDLCVVDMDEAEARFEAVKEAAGHHALLVLRLDLLWGVRLALAGQSQAAVTTLQGVTAACDALGASGWGELARRALDRLAPAGTLDAGAVPDAGVAATTAAAATTTAAAAGPHTPTSTARPSTVEVAPVPAGTVRAVDDGNAETAMTEAPRTTTPTDEGGGTAPWRIELLGTLRVWRDGEVVALPHSLASQALMIVALRQQVPVEELVDLLWPDAEPGVGLRRMRNVLWRIRTLCGELLQRDGSVIRLAVGAVVDVEEFRRIGTHATRQRTPHAEAVSAARAAVRLYRGELLPGERYADWSAGPRESLSRLHIQLLELLLDDALDLGHLQDALGLLDRLIEADPYDEGHRLRLAELYGRTGNRGRALRVLDQAQEMLDELDLHPSDELLRLRRTVNAASTVVAIPPSAASSARGIPATETALHQEHREPAPISKGGAA